MNEENLEQKKKINIFQLIKENKKIQYLIIAILFISLLFVVFSGFNKDEEQVVKISTSESYVENLENRLSETLSKVEGAGKVSVVITTESGMETVLATTITSKTTEKGTEKVETPIIVNGKTVVLKEKYPKIIGVLIVAEGANNIITMSKIQSATVSLLDIDANQIEILTMK